MNLKTSIRILLAGAVVVISGCAKEYKADTAAQTRNAFDAWVKVHYKNAIIDTTQFGELIIEDIPGTGAELPDTAYVYMEYYREIMESGKIDSYVTADVAQKLGKYKPENYYGPRLVYLADGSNWVGISDMIKGGCKLGRMREGGKRTVLMPGWLTTATRYSTADDYVKNVTGTNYLYSMTVKKVVKDHVQWQIDSMKAYLENRKIKADTTVSKSIFYGVVTPGKDVKFGKDTTIYINYTGRLLNGQVFDTTIKDTAKVHGIYSAAKEYKPVSIKTASDSTAYTMGSSSSSVITGFSLTLHQMHPFEKGVGVFTSDYGYKDTGSGDAIPPYSPLVFEIEVVAQP